MVSDKTDRQYPDRLIASSQLADIRLPLRILYLRVVDWALTNNFASFLDIDRAAAKHLGRMDQVVYSDARLNLPVTHVRSNFSIYPTRSNTKLHFFRDAYRQATRLHQRHHYHLIYADDPMWSGLTGYLLKRRFRLPLLIKCHSDYYGSLAWRRENPRYHLDYLLSLWLIRKADWVTTVTRTVAENLLQLGVRSERLSVLPTLVRTGLFRPRGQAPEDIAPSRILFVGRLEKQKGLPHLLQALSMLIRRGNPVKLTVAGEGSQKVKLKRLTRRLEITNRVQFLGFQPHKQLRDLYWQHAFLVLPSLHEALGKVTVEAGLCGLPTIGTRVGGIPEVIEPGETGLLVPPGNAAALADAIELLCHNPDRVTEMGSRAAVEYRRRFDFPLILRRLLEVYARAAGLSLLPAEETEGDLPC